MTGFCALQMNSKWGEPDENRRRAAELLEALSYGQVDFVVLPEMVFSGYIFQSRHEIEPFAEDEMGETFQFCRTHAKRLGSCVAAGFVLRESASGILYNAMTVVSKDGALLTTYRKTFLYEADKVWARKGPGFQTLDVHGWTVSPGICMDLNPEDFDVYKDNFAMAAHCRDSGTNVILFSTNWLLSGEENGNSENEPDELHQYWYYRLKPMHGQPAVFIAANRTGLERGTRFAGKSCIIDLGTKQVLGSADSETDCLVHVVQK